MTILPDVNPYGSSAFEGTISNAIEECRASLTENIEVHAEDIYFYCGSVFEF